MSKYNKPKDQTPSASGDQFLTLGQRILNAMIRNSAQALGLIVLALLVYVGAWGWAQIAEGRREKASEMLSQALKIYHAELLSEKDTAGGSEELPRFKTAKERADAAIQALEKLKEEYPRSEANTAGILARAGILYDQGRYADADGAYRQFLEKGPKDPLALALAKEGLGLCAEAQGKAEAALNIYKEPSVEFLKGRLLFDQARVLAKKGEKKQAAEAYGEVIKLKDSPLQEEARNRTVALED